MASLKPPEEESDKYPVSGMSNFDGTIEDGFEEELKNNKVFGRHAGWSFNGKVWFEGGMFHEEVWVFKEAVKVVSEDTLEELMEAVNSEFGYE